MRLQCVNRNFGVKSAKVGLEAQMGTKPAKVGHLAATLLKYVRKKRKKKYPGWVRFPVYLASKRPLRPLNNVVQWKKT